MTSEEGQRAEARGDSGHGCRDSINPFPIQHSAFWFCCVLAVGVMERTSHFGAVPTAPVRCGCAPRRPRRSRQPHVGPKRPRAGYGFSIEVPRPH